VTVSGGPERRASVALGVGAGGRHFSPTDPGSTVTAAGFELAVEAIAGDTKRARDMACSVIEDVDRWSDVVWHGELVVILGICRLRDADPSTALIYLSAARRSPMRFPVWYVLARRHAAQAQEQLDPHAALAAIAEG
jgi:hypothetical protein